MASSAVTGILSYKAAKSIFEFLKEELFMGKVIIVRLKKPAEEVTSAGVRPNEAVPQGISDVEVAILHERVASLCEMNNRVFGQAQRIMNMGDDVFDPDTAVGLLQRIAVLDGRATVLSRKLEDVGFAGHTIQTCRGIRSNAELMYSDLKQRLSGEN